MSEKTPKKQAEETLDKINLAIAALNESPDNIKFDSMFCGCHSLFNREVVCDYCRIHHGLSKAKEFIKLNHEVRGGLFD